MITKSLTRSQWSVDNICYGWDEITKLLVAGLPRKGRVLAKAKGKKLGQQSLGSGGRERQEKSAVYSWPAQYNSVLHN